MPAISLLLKEARKFCLFALTLLLAACGSGGGGGGGTPMPDSGSGLRLEQINTGSNLTFPLFLTVTPLPGDTRLFVVEKGGKIKIVDRDPPHTVIGTFLDISNLLTNPLGGEQGLLGLAFDPLYAINKRFYVSYTDRNGIGNSVIARYLVSNDPNVAVATADQIIITVTQPFENHNGGMIAFGPDNFLYIGLGDGGSGGDPGNRAQNPAELLGKLLRIDVSQTAPVPYGIPPLNPYVGQLGKREEIWSIGLRNPWRYSFDRQSGDLYVADVGEGAREEVNVSAGASGGGKEINYGWRLMEGSLCFNPAMNCNAPGLLTLPVIEYSHSEGCSITGGYVYRGAAVPALRGTYFYADYCVGFVRSFRLVNGVATELADWPTLDPGVGLNVTSFGEDAAGELYIMTQQGGLYRIVPTN